jgi:hypothetical protein
MSWFFNDVVFIIANFISLVSPVFKSRVEMSVSTINARNLSNNSVTFDIRLP